MGFSRRRNVVFDDQRPAWDSSTSDLAQFKLDKDELEVSSSGCFFSHQLRRPGEAGGEGGGETFIFLFFFEINHPLSCPFVVVVFFLCGSHPTNYASNDNLPPPGAASLANLLKHTQTHALLTSP